jgi:hypothetical protein
MCRPQSRSITERDSADEMSATPTARLILLRIALFPERTDNTVNPRDARPSKPRQILAADIGGSMMRRSENTSAQIVMNISSPRRLN